jgi:transglutaminase-like putative cysteine protease
MTHTRILVCLGLFALIAVNPGSAWAEESWDSVFIAGTKVGSLHSTIEPFKDRGRQRLRVRVDLALRFQRLDATVTIQMRQATVETGDGAVESLDVRTRTGGQDLHVFGTAKNGQMTLTIDGSTQRQQQTLVWGPEIRGPLGVEQSLAHAPMKPGERRTLRMFLTDLNTAADIALTARDPEEVRLAGSLNTKLTLLRIEQTTAVDGKPRPEFDMTLWADPQGRVKKTSSDNLGGMVTYRTTRKDALAPAPAGQGGAPPFDQITSSIIKVSPPITRPSTSRAATYRVSLKNDDPAHAIPADRRQSLKLDGAKNTVVLQVAAVGPDAGEAGPAQTDPEYVRPNAMIDSADSRVVELSRRAVGDAAEPWEKVVRIEGWVATNLKDKNFQVTFAPASAVARSLAGDCTEHGVLTAAMCRAAGIPARVVVGLVYAEPLGGFGFHLWNEVYVNRRWVAVDATYHQTDVDATHIKLADSSLDGIAPFEAFLPVVRVLGKMTIVPVEVR